MEFGTSLIELLEQFVDNANAVIWSDVLVYFILAVGIYFSFRLRFFQVRMLGDMIRCTFKGDSSGAGISSFQALAVSLSGRVGTGNIAGVATAIFIGGPGAVFWMWMVAFLGAGAAFIESTLAQIYKVKQDGQYRGGPAYYIEKGFRNKRFGKIYAVVFALTTILATGFLLPGVQANSISSSVHQAFSLGTDLTGMFLVALLGLIIFGGIKAIARVAEFVVPFMALGYILLAVVIMVMNYTAIPDVFSLIFRSAFGGEAAFGGIIGSMISIGVKRGLYSNEAGQGTGPHPAAAAEVSHPAKQGMVQALSCYIDTLLVCTATAVMILVTGMYNVRGADGNMIVDNGVHYTHNGVQHVEGSAVYTQAAIDKALSGQEVFNENYVGAGSYFVAVALFFFAFTTLMAYYYIAETNVAYLTGKKNRPRWLFILKLLMLGSVYLGAVRTATLAWGLGDMGVGLMAWLNVVAILILQKPAISAFRDYERQLRAGKDPEYDPVALGVKDADFWEHEYRPAQSGKASEVKSPESVAS